VNKLTVSAWNRLGRTAFQFLVSAGFVELVLQRLADADLPPEQQLMLTGAVQMLAAFLHRRYLDPSPVPSLVDGNGHAGTAYEGLRVRGDGRGVT
jgi:hypothetical protein